MRYNRHAALAALASFGVVFVLGTGAARPAAAQQPPALIGPSPVPVPVAPPSGPQIILTPYLWLAGINAAINTPLARAPVVNSSVGAFQLYGHLDGVPFIGAAEIRDGPFSLLGDVIHLPVGTDITTHNVLFQGGNAALTANIGTAIFLYHAIDEPVQELDAGLGFRAWGVSTRLTLNGRLLPTAGLSRDAGWADPLIAARYHRDFGNGFGVTAYGDVGGFDVAAAHVDWQVLGTIDYTVKPWATLRLGYRSLNVSASGNVLGYNVHMKGPILGASFRF